MKKVRIRKRRENEYQININKCRKRFFSFLFYCFSLNNVLFFGKIAIKRSSKSMFLYIVGFVFIISCHLFNSAFSKKKHQMLFILRKGFAELIFCLDFFEPQFLKDFLIVKCFMEILQNGCRGISSNFHEGSFRNDDSIRT